MTPAQMRGLLELAKDRAQRDGHSIAVSYLVDVLAELIPPEPASRKETVMLTLKLSPPAGYRLDEVFVQMGAVARRIGLAIECEMNGCTFWAYPGDTTAELLDAYKRLYDGLRSPSRFVAVHIKQPAGTPRHSPGASAT